MKQIVVSDFDNLSLIVIRDGQPLMAHQPPMGVSRPQDGVMLLREPAIVLVVDLSVVPDFTMKGVVNAEGQTLLQYRTEAFMYEVDQMSEPESRGDLSRSFDVLPD